MNSSGLNGNNQALSGSALTAAYNNAFSRQFPWASWSSNRRNPTAA